MIGLVGSMAYGVQGVYLDKTAQTKRCNLSTFTFSPPRGTINRHSYAFSWTKDLKANVQNYANALIGLIM